MESEGQLVKAADYAVRAIATSSEYVRPGGGVVWTKQRFAVKEAYWGVVPPELEIIFNGGITDAFPAPNGEPGALSEKNGPYLVLDSQYVPYEQGAEYLLFLDSVPAAPYRIAGLSDGYYRVSDGRLESPTLDEGVAPSGEADLVVTSPVSAKLSGALLEPTIARLRALRTALD